MSSDDSDYFESADDEQGTHDRGGGSKSGGGGGGTKSNRNIKSKKHDTQPQEGSSKDNNKDEGWDDFDVDVDDDDDDKPASLQSPPPPLTSHKQPSPSDKQDEGWEDDFDEWEESKEVTDQHQQSNTISKIVSKPSSSSIQATHTESDFKGLADKLSALGERQQTLDNHNTGGWSSWGGWGASLLTSGVTQLTTHVSQGISTVANVLETGIGVPNPEEYARIQKAEKDAVAAAVREKVDDSEPQTSDDVDDPTSTSQSKDDGFGVFKLDSIVSNVSKMVEKTTQSAVVVGGLDTLEEIGKRTMRFLQGEDEGKKVLSDWLREAREKADGAPLPDNSLEVVSKKTPMFETLFDDFQGLVHYEALEMLSKQCDAKIQSLLQRSKGSELTDIKETLNQVKEICELNDDYEDVEGKVDGFEKLFEDTLNLGVPVNFNNVVSCWKDVRKNCEDNPNETEDPKPELTDEEIENLATEAVTKIAESSALSVQLLHRTTALLATRERRSTADEADGLTQLTNFLISGLNGVGAQYSLKIMKISKDILDTNKNNEMITNIFLDAEKGTSLIKDAFNLTIPIVQVGAI